MKTRNGFVSNSSSSSFIIAIGKVIDKEKLLSFLKNNNISSYEYNICKKTDIFKEDTFYWLNCNSSRNYSCGAINSNKFIVYGVGNKSVELDLNVLKEEDEILIISIINRIYFNELLNDYCDYDNFTDLEMNLYNGLNEENGVINVDKNLGAGRD